ncbi:hypothetical protein GR212_33220 [Rhizobium lusitanum]|uniref:Uncharacterized protein n=1 Tax=Rhizobium lusitanum TaxID=293958 RepID=A0A6L9UEI9_9HYPH|nr:hypothetical protein [Rhizobium lusitanum]NEI74415.1 hypothetical protein [Rhizobium lusitanum]
MAISANVIAALTIFPVEALKGNPPAAMRGWWAMRQATNAIRFAGSADAGCRLNHPVVVAGRELCKSSMANVQAYAFYLGG